MNASQTITTDTATTKENGMNDHNTDEQIFERIYSLTLDRNLKGLKKIQSEIGKDKLNEITRNLNYNDDMIAESLKWVTKHWKESPAEKIAKFEAMEAEFKTPENLEEAIQIAERFISWENLKGLKILKDTVSEEMWSGVMEEMKKNSWLYEEELKHLSEYWGKIDHTKKENAMKTETIKRTPSEQKEYVENLREEHGDIIDGIIDAINDYAKRNNTRGCFTHIWIGSGIPLTSDEAWHLVKLTELRNQQFMVSGTLDNMEEYHAQKHGVAIGRFTHEEWEARTMDTVYDNIRHSVVYTTPMVLSSL